VTAPLPIVVAADDGPARLRAWAEAFVAEQKAAGVWPSDEEWAWCERCEAVGLPTSATEDEVVRAETAAEIGALPLVGSDPWKVYEMPEWLRVVARTLEVAHRVGPTLKDARFAGEIGKALWMWSVRAEGRALEAELERTEPRQRKEPRRRRAA
jgi:hypothetical protein